MVVPLDKAPKEVELLRGSVPQLPAWLYRLTAHLSNVSQPRPTHPPPTNAVPC